MNIGLACKMVTLNCWKHCTNQTAKGQIVLTNALQQHYMQPVDIADRPGKVNNKFLQPSHVLEILQIQFPML